MNREECFKKIIEILSKSDFIANNDSNDGRINSTVDEKKIIDIFLQIYYSSNSVLMRFIRCRPRIHIR